MPAGAFTGNAGGAVCGDLIRLDLTIAGDRVADAGFEASGCGAVVAAGSAAVALVRGRLAARRRAVGAGEVSAELGGLSPGKLHAAELAADALHSRWARPSPRQARRPAPRNAARSWR